MNVFTASELASKTKSVCTTVDNEGCAFITNNGKTNYLIVDISQFSTLNEAVRSYDAWRARQKLDAIWCKTVGTTMPTEEEIEEEIASARKALHGRAALGGSGA